MMRAPWLLRILSLFVILSVVLVACAPAAPAPAEEAAAPAEEKAEEAAAPAEEGPKRGGVITFALYQEPEILNPHICTQTACDEVNEFILESPLGVDPDGNFFPILAKEVPSAENGGVSDDGLTITVRFKEGIKWSDGEPFTADDFKFTWEAIMHPESGAVSTTGWRDIESIETPDDYTAVIKFKQFYAPYLALLTAEIIPRHATGDPANMPKWDFNWHPIGTGPFMMTEWVSGDHITLVRNPNYREAPEKPYLDGVNIIITPSREVGKALIKTGDIDILWDLVEADIPEFENLEGVVLAAPPDTGTERLLLNLADPTIDATDDPLNNPHWALGDLRVRQAIQYGIDKAKINDELLYGKATLGTSEINLGWAKCDIPVSEFNPEKARQLLEEAGWVDQDGDGIRECRGCPYAEEGRPLRLKIQTTSGNKLREQVEQLLVEMMRDIGIDLYIENVPSSVLFGSWASGAFRKHGHFDILMYTTSYGIDPQAHMEGYFASWSMPTEANGGRGFNYSRWVDEEADAAIKEAGSSPDLEVRKAAYQRLCERIAAGLPHIYLYDRLELNAYRTRLHGWIDNNWMDLGWNAEDWWVSE
ncbi:MAG: peptide ABC transporter substrate-binding protein [Chloroflexi bacterium]|nr:peptide ABC transporter substrate-binding protein [Chloroflexota bacterium]